MKKRLFIPIVLIAIMLMINVVHAEISYTIVVYPGPGTTSIVFNSTDYYDIVYDSNYNIIMPQAKVYEIVIHNNVNETLFDYQVKIDLRNDLGFTDFDIDPGSIYFIDEYGNPLYYYIEEFDPNTTTGIVWIKIPFLEALGNITIYMIYGGINPYLSYNDYSQVFLGFFNGSQGTLDSFWGLFGSAIYDPANMLVQLTDASINVEGVVALKNGLSERSWKLDFSGRLAGSFIAVSFYSDVYGGTIVGDSNTATFSNGYYIMFNDYGDYIKITHRSGGVDTDLTSVAYTFTSGTVYNFKIEFLNGLVRVYVNNSLVLTYTIANPDYTYNNFGIEGRNGANAGVKTLNYAVLTKYVDPEPSIVKVTYLGSTGGSSAVIDSSSGFMAIMASRYKSDFYLYNSGSWETTRVGFDYNTSGWNVLVGTYITGLGDIGYDNDYFLYRVISTPSLYTIDYSFIVNDFYTGQYISKTVSSDQSFTLDSVYYGRPYLFYIAFSPVDSNVAKIFIKAPPNFYVDNVSVTDLYAYYKHTHVYIYFIGNDAYIELNYNDNPETYYPLRISFVLKLGDLPDRNTYDASRSLEGSSSTDSSSSSGSSSGSIWDWSGFSSDYSSIEWAGGSFPALLLTTMLLLTILLPGVLLYRRYWLYPVMIGLLVLARIGYVYFYVPIVLFTIFAAAVFLKDYFGEEYGLITGIILAFFMNIFIISGSPETAPSPPGNPLEIPQYVFDLLSRAILFTYLPYPFSYIMSLFFASLAVLAVLRLIIKVIRGI